MSSQDVPAKPISAADSISVKGAREHNLKEVNVDIPRNQFVVITGVSGSGKSSLAFDTIYAEGYRKYIDSLSTKARMVLEQIPRPDVDYIQGLSPVIALEQRTGGGGNPRSTVATVTEIADFARVLWAVCGTPYCPKDGGIIERRSMDDCLTRIYAEAEGSRLMILAPWMTAKPAILREELPRLQQRGFQRVRLNGVIRRLDENDLIESRASSITVEIVVDRIVLKADQRSRIADSLDLAFSEGEDRAIVMVQEDPGWREIPLSNRLACVNCGDVYEGISPRHFSWNHAEGACPECGGLGETLQFQPELIVPDSKISVKKGAIKPWRLGSKQMIIRHNALLKQLAEQLPFDPNLPWEELEPDIRRQIIHGAGQRLFSFKLKGGHSKPESMPFEGVLADLENIRLNTSSEGLRARLMAYQTSSQCAACGGRRLRQSSLNVLIEGRSITDLLAMSLQEAQRFVEAIHTQANYAAVSDAVRGLSSRLSFLNEVGLSYLTLNRPYATLSGGEAQRVRLATQLGMSLVGVVYLLDEPSIGLHPLDNRRLIQTLTALRERGNSVVVVEHDGETMLAADHLIELGPGAGIEGGELIYQGSPTDSFQDTRSRSGMFLSGALRVEKNAPTLRPRSDWLKIEGACENNLKQVDVKFPVGLLSVVCGMSGSGKSTLVNDILAKAAAFQLNRAKTIPGKHTQITGLDHFLSVIQVDQSPIGRSPRSNPATFTKLFDQLRDLFAKCSLAKIRGYKRNRFSFNVSGGRCERCKGDGMIKLDMQFMADVYSECPSCNGRRYNRETLDVRFKGYSIADVLEMSVSEALQIFGKQPRIAEKLQTLADVGLGYVQLGQPATTLSGGEAQRIKLSLELSKRQQGQTLYILDEPTTGLHWIDVQRLMDLLFKLRDAGNTILIIEHDLDVIRMADWIVELGPEGGEAGGEILFQAEGDAFFKGDRTPTQSVMNLS
ncbi:excinuclease ABC subunit UvrA [Coraliomargarita sp. SDUM461004]|uniref:UvrABC system protein A n=1 Tax=Thalassobacterium sedimentorum TaxID=3041258 RepID=A0ABU1ALF3_9BACT|nr:excinuclease ABC subunit UvrA [Coraliomargarita sp. SDUM461004]MDQ8195616.1 excinuclease ABC subunit UvrA [Coraliomargarita sp. SDUM461004]